MSEQDLRVVGTVPEALTNLLADSERLCAMMCRWWAGWTLARIALEQGISRQRASQALAWCGCTAQAWHKAKRGHADSLRRASRQRMVEARLLLDHPLMARLTARQRGALLWLSQGLILTDIARRMATTAQAVNGHIFAARWRLKRLEAKQVTASVSVQAASAGGAIDAEGLDSSFLSELLNPVSRAQVAIPVAAECALPAAEAMNGAAPATLPADTAPAVADVSPQPQADDAAKESPAESRPPAKPHEPVETEPAAEQERDLYVERYGNPEGPDSPQESPSSQSQKPRLRLSELQREKRGW